MTVTFTASTYMTGHTYKAYTRGDRRRDEHLFNRATNWRWRLSPRRSPVVYTRGDRRDNRHDDRSDRLPRRSPRVYALLQVTKCDQTVTVDRKTGSGEDF